MRLAEISVPEKKPEDREINERGLFFMSDEEGVKDALSCSAGKVLLISDGNCFLFADAACSPRTIALVFDGDCLPLFSMPDGVSSVLACGGKELLHAARYFAEVRGIPCTLFPADASLDGAFETHGEVLLGDEPIRASLREGRVICDCERLASTLSRAYGRILLSRLAVLEGKALTHFQHGTDRIAPYELPSDLTAKEIILANARGRERERAGAPVGEGIILANLLRERGEPYPEWRAYLQLSALYAAFFEKGKPRRYYTPNYRKRASMAGTDYSLTRVPSAEEYVVRAITLERIRAPFAKAAVSLSDERRKQLRVISELAGEKLPIKAGNLAALKVLPEFAPDGLSAIIRDFGLMEWEI